MSTENDIGLTSGQSSFSYEVPKQRTDIITDEELFNAADLKEAAGRLDTAFQTFANILMDTNDLVNSRVNASCQECIFGSYGAQLLEMWNSNVPTFSDFKTNFESWSRAVSVIATRDENSEAIAQAIYNNRTTGSDLTTADGRTVSEMREEILSAANTIEDNTSGGWSSYKDAAADGASNILTETEFARRNGENGYTCTDANGNSVTVDNYQDYLDIMYEKYGPNSVATSGSDTPASQSAESATENYFIQKGDECVVYGKKVTFFVRDGSYNYYKDENGQIFVDADGGLRPMDVNEATWNINYLKDPSGCYTAVTTTSEGASEMNLPTEVSNTNIPYDEYGAAEYVDSRTIPIEDARTYTTNEGFRQDLLSDENLPEVIEFDHKLESSSWDIIQPDIKPSSNGKVTLVYDERAGKYYQVDDSGTYVRDMYGYTPSELAKFDIEDY